MSADLDERFRPPPEFRPAIRRSCRRLLKIMRHVAREHGYPLVLHGSIERDLDVAAIPWTAEAVDRETLVSALTKAVRGVVTGGPANEKPHGRWAYIITLERGRITTPAGQYPFIDSGVMEFVETEKPCRTSDSGWVNDEGWSQPYPENPRPRVPRGEMIPAVSATSLAGMRLGRSSGRTAGDPHPRHLAGL